MITVVQGRVGNGKSYEMCRRIIAHLLRGGVVATNMRILLSEIRRIYGRRIGIWQLIEISAESDPRKIPRGDFRGAGRRRVFVVLDEALNWFESRTGPNDNRRVSWGEWLRQSDKLGQDVVFIAQEFARAAKWIRELAQICDDVRNFGQARLWGMPIGRWLCLGRVYVVVHADVRTKQLLGVDVHVTGPSVWRCYCTSELYGFAASASAFDGHVVWPAYRVPGRSLLWLSSGLVGWRALVELFR